MALFGPVLNNKGLPICKLQKVMYPNSRRLFYRVTPDVRPWKDRPQFAHALWKRAYKACAELNSKGTNDYG